jgi:hypothetical protein
MATCAGVREIVLAVPALLRPVLIVFSLFFAICLLLCGEAFIFIRGRDILDSGATAHGTEKVKEQESREETEMKTGIGSSFGMVKRLLDIGGTMGYLIFVALSIGGVVNVVLDGFW